MDVKTQVRLRGRKGISGLIYNMQRSHSRRRGHDPPNYNLTEFREWLFSQPNFENLYKNWIESNYDKWKKPSVDRLDDSRGYSFDNIQLTTWRENSTKQYIGNRKKVIQMDLNGVFIKEWGSYTEVVSHFGFSVDTCLRKITKTAYNFKWKYKDNKNDRSKRGLW